MRRRESLFNPRVCSAALLAALTPLVPRAEAQDRPHILWLTSEDHGPEMGCYGDTTARTPHVDALAARGMRFTKVWSTAPVCAPARTALLTGLYPSSAGALHMRSMVPLPSYVRTYPELLRDAGYYCTNNAKEDYNVETPADLWNESSPRAHWKDRADGQPFFAVFNSTRSHESQIRKRPHVAVTDPAKVRVPAYHPDTAEVRQDWAQYYDKVSEADADAGARLAELEAAGLADDTIVFYYGDHGSGLPRSKRWPSNSGLHVPLVVYFPEKWQHLAPAGYQPGGYSDRLVGFVDFAPTVLSLAGIGPPTWMQGRAFAGRYQVAGAPFLFGERGRMDERVDLVRSVTDGRFVYLRNYYPHVSQAQRIAYQFLTPTTRVWHALFEAGETNEAQSIFWRVPKAPEELYDLQTDPDEVHNLAGSPAHAQVLERLRRAQRAHLVDIHDVGFLPEGEMHHRATGRTPLELGQDRESYPLARVVQAAELASGLEDEAIPSLLDRLADGDSAVRFWAILGLLMRGEAGVGGREEALRPRLEDASPYVRVAAAEALGRFGASSVHAEALATLREVVAAEGQGVWAAMDALAAIEALGPTGEPLHDFLRQWEPRLRSPHARFDEYVPRLAASITAGQPPAEVAPAR